MAVAFTKALCCGDGWKAGSWGMLMDVTMTVWKDTCPTFDTGNALFIRNKVILRTLFIIFGNYPHCAQRSHATRAVAWPKKGGTSHFATHDLPVLNLKMARRKTRSQYFSRLMYNPWTIPLLPSPRAFDPLPCPGRGELDGQQRTWDGAFDHNTRWVGNLICCLDFMFRAALRIEQLADIIFLFVAV